jgi:1,4-alpha-glucan branching enzyme
MDGWLRDGMESRLTLTLSPTLCSMLLDPLLQDRYQRHLEALIELAEKEIHRTHWDNAYRPLAWMYHHRFTTIREHVAGLWPQSRGRVPQISGTGKARNHHLRGHPRPAATARGPSAFHPRANPRCARSLPELFRLRSARHLAAGMRLRRRRGKFLQEANIRWFIIDTHGILHARPRPRYGVFAPIFTPNCIAAFGRDLDSARQVWSNRKAIPAISITAIFTATSVSTWILIMSNRICRI